MKKLVKLTALSLLALAGLSGMAHAENYFTIKELRETTPAVWQAAYETEKADTVAVDVPITLPAVDTFPLIRVTAPETWRFSDAVDATKAEDNAFFAGMGYDSFPGQEMAWRESGNGISALFPTEDAALETMLRLFHATSPDAADVMLEPSGICFYQYGAQSDGEWWGNFYQTFHGIPCLRTLDYLNPPTDQFRQKWPKVLGMLHAFLYREDIYWLNGSLYQEKGIEAEDVPLLPWDAIRASLEQRIEQGYIKEIEEVRLGYTAIVDVEHPREYLLVPCWFVRGDLRYSLHDRFYKPEEKEGVVRHTAYEHFSNGSAFLFPAQTGEFVDYLGDKRPDEIRYTLPILRWEDVQ